MGNNLNLAITNGVDDNVVTEVADTALDLDAVVEELLEGRDIEDLVACGLRSVDDELRSVLVLCILVKIAKCNDIPSG